jgi:dTDP-4-amino-4,6-dideoxygalactose transaminase
VFSRVEEIDNNSVLASVSTEQNNGLLLGDMAVTSFNPTKQLTDFGDCGMLFFDEHGTPWCMHHILFHSANSGYISFDVPLHAVLEGHPEYFGENSVVTNNLRTVLHDDLPQAEIANGDVIKACTIFKTHLVNAAPFMSQMTPVRQHLTIKTRIVEAGPYRGGDEGT